MCGRFVQVINIRKLESTYGISVAEGEDLHSSYNVAPGDYAYVISSSTSNEFSRYRFGMTPSWAKKPMYIFNARSEGDANKENSPEFRGKKGIIMKPSFRKPIRSQRCIVIANAFVEGSEKEKLNKPYVKERKWLDSKLPLVDVLRYLKPYPGEFLEAFPVSVKIKNPKNKEREVLVPVGERLTTDKDDIVITKDLKLQGMGNRKKR